MIKNLLNQTMLRTIALVFLLSSITNHAFAQDKPIEAWWLTAHFTASETQYAGIEIKSIEPTWKKLSVLSYAVLPPDAKADVNWMRQQGFSFSKQGNLSHRGFLDRAVVGVFEDESGKVGRFLLVLRKSASGSWKTFFLHTEPDEPGFSVLVTKGATLYWGTCMQCENFRKLVIARDNAHLE